MTRQTLYVLLTAAVVALAACGKKEEPAKPAAVPAPPPVATPAPTPAPAPAGVTAGNITIGKGIGADKKVAAASDTFAKTDTFYVSIDTTGTGTATLTAKWTYHKDGKSVPVKEDTQTISPTGPATSEFHVSKPDGWPTGDYEVEVLVGDKSVGVRKFAVK